MELSDNAPGPGTLLIAPPTVQDPNFFRAVVLLCEHSANGSFGLILNRPIEVDIEILSTELTGFRGGISFGGPVQPDTLHFVHQLDIPDAAPFMPKVNWGGDFEAVKEICRERTVTDNELKLFLGYSGWGAGQLHDEIQAGGWILTPGDPEAIFGDEPEELWRKRLRRLGGEYAVLANFPIDPRLN